MPGAKPSGPQFGQRAGRLLVLRPGGKVEAVESLAKAPADATWWADLDQGGQWQRMPPREEGEDVPSRNV